jgi:MFS transporter, MHS family, shikimate and dehydroshikimate transport protein
MVTNSSGGSKRALILLSSMVGTALEQYDFLLYGAAASLIFNKLFFPALDPVAGTIAAFSTYAVGFLARPFGGILFGHYGDKLGRRFTLMLTLVMMGGASALIGCLPTYNAIGIWSPVLLVVCRLVQGIALGGEQGGAILIAVENAPRGRRGLWGSFAPAGSSLGILLSFGVMSLTAELTGPNFAIWGWRIPFLLSIFLVAIGIVVRSRISETPAFAKLKEHGGQSRVPILELLQRFPKQVCITFGIRLGELGWATVVVIVTASYATTTLHLPRTLILTAVTYAAALAVLTIPLVGALSDRVGRKPLLYAGGILMAGFAWPYFELLQTRDPLYVTIAIVIGWGVITPLSYATESAFFSELFETRVRYSGINLGQQLSGVISGGLLPIFATIALQKTAGAPWPIITLLIAMASLMILATASAPETSRSSLDHVDPEPSLNMNPAAEEFPT